MKVGCQWLAVNKVIETIKQIYFLIHPVEWHVGLTSYSDSRRGTRTTSAEAAATINGRPSVSRPRGSSDR